MGPAWVWVPRAAPGWPWAGCGVRGAGWGERRQPSCPQDEVTWTLGSRFRRKHPDGPALCLVQSKVKPQAYGKPKGLFPGCPVGLVCLGTAPSSPTQLWGALSLGESILGVSLEASL